MYSSLHSMEQKSMANGCTAVVLSQSDWIVTSWRAEVTAAIPIGVASFCTWRCDGRALTEPDGTPPSVKPIITSTLRLNPTRIAEL